MEQYEPILYEIKRTLIEDLTERDESYPYLTHEIKIIEAIIQRLKPTRTKRAINELGTIWKWVARSPDHDDFQIISDKINDVLRSNNRQVVINRLVEERINELINRTNKITNIIKSNEQIKKDLSKELERKLKVMKEEIVNVDYAIQWAKAGIINSFILSDLELRITKEFFDEQNMIYVNLLEAIEYGDVKIVSNALTLIYIISLPKTNEENCKNLLVKAVRKNNSIIKIPNNNIIVCKNDVLEIISKCKTLNDVSVCKEGNFKNVSNSACLPKLLHGQSSACTMTNAQHIPQIEEINPGILLLNAYNGTIEIGEKLVNLEGTFLLEFHNATIKANQRTYESRQISKAKPLPAIIQPGNISLSFEEILSLKMLKELHSVNTEEIKALGTKYEFSVYSLSGIVILLLIILTIKIIFRRRTKSFPVTTVIDKTEKIPDITSSKQDGILKTSNISLMTMTSAHLSEDTELFKGGGVNDSKISNEINIFAAPSAFPRAPVAQ